jgi:hypothetical protein
LKAKLRLFLCLAIGARFCRNRFPTIITHKQPKDTLFPQLQVASGPFPPDLLGKLSPPAANFRDTDTHGAAAIGQTNALDALRSQTVDD